MSFFRFRSRIVNNLKQPAGSILRGHIEAVVTEAEPALMFQPHEKFASVREIPPAPVARIPIRPAPRFSSKRRVMMRAVLKRGKA